jgi:hypothetical protein
MLGGYALKWVGLFVILAGVLVMLAGMTAGGSGVTWLGVALMLGGGFLRYVSRQTVRTVK